MSEHLGKQSISHLVMERGRIAERWRSARWDSLVANGPAWHDRLPSMKFLDVDDNDYASKDSIAAYFEAYAKMIHAPIRSGVEVLSVKHKSEGKGFRIKTSEGSLEALDRKSVV